MWNGGIFAYKLQYVLKKADEIIGYSDYDALWKNYARLPEIPFDYAVVEKEASIQVMRFAGEWKDIGTWNTLTEALDKAVVGNEMMDGACGNVHIINEMDIPILAMGLRDIVISASSGGILVSGKEQSSHIKPYVEEICQNQSTDSGRK